MSDQCPNKKECGSCEWSEIPYSEQLKKKLSAINECFQDNGFDYKVIKIEASPEISHYRNRMDFVIDYQGNFGLRQKGKWWKVIDNHTCFISDKRIEDAFHICYKWLKESGLSFRDRKTYEGLLSYIVLRCTKAGGLMVNVVTGTDYRESEIELIKEKLEKLSKVAGASTLLWSVNRTKSDVSFGDEISIIHGSGYIEETINGCKYRLTPNSFFQTNSAAAAVLQNKVLEFAKKTNAQNILDLYCGSGFFTIPLSRIAGNITGVEVVEESVETARVNAEVNNSCAKFICSKSEDMNRTEIPVELTILDPPRAGLHPEVLETLLSQKPKNIIYVSCNYRKFIEEMKRLSTVYKISSCVAVDMFPQTHHVELVTLLTKK
jgi:23S rRNA (uracil1939-C5)-methyltransferase